jgi:hypothetical protein
MRVTRSRPPFLLFAVALAAGGCSRVAALADAGPDSDTDTDPGTDTGSDTDTGTGVDIWEWTCSLPLDTACNEIADMPEAYDLDFAAPIFADLTFVHASRSPIAILAERATDSGPEPIVLFVRDSDDVAQVGVVPPPTGPLTAVAIGSPRRLQYSDSFGFHPNDEHFGYIAAALLCGETGCGLYRPALDEENEPIGLEAIPGGEVPLSDPRALAWVQTIAGDDGFMPGSICVAGDGVACFDGEGWGETWDPGGGMLNAIAVELMAGDWPTGLWVAGENGRIATDRDGDWTEIDSGSSMDFVSISAFNGIWAAGGADGFVFGDTEHAIPCEFGSAYSATFVHESFASSDTILSLTALAADHVVEIVATPAGVVSCVQPTDFAGAPRNADYWPGGADAVFGYALTTGGLYRRVEYATGIDG